MKIFVKAKPNAKEEKIEKIDPPSPNGFGRASDSHFMVSVKEPPVEGRANKSIIKVLAEYFNVQQSDVKIISGHASKNKMIEIK
ncbi:MAG: DUF167 domain-containing protein [Patescibacteria group bacterium]